VNVVDDPARSSFIVPSVLQKKDLILAISTSGRSPALAGVLRRRLEKEIGPEYAVLLNLFGKIRKELLSRGLGQKTNAKMFRELAKEDLLPLVRKRRAAEMNRRLKAALGPGFSLRELGFWW
jgi:precorrin-2 dehydrogenase/sirohydrochlorin ferrochelatase